MIFVRKARDYLDEVVARLRQELPSHQFVEDDAIDLRALLLGRAAEFHFAFGELFWIHVAFDQRPGPSQSHSFVAIADCLFRDYFRNVQPR